MPTHKIERKRRAEAAKEKAKHKPKVLKGLIAWFKALFAKKPAKH
jgi:hypothetical protein